MILSKARSSISAHGERGHKTHHPKLPQRQAPSIPDFLELLDVRNYKGAITVLQFQRMADPCEKKTLEWLAYAHFHHGEHDKALLLYKELLETHDADPTFHTFSAACLFYMAAYEDAKQSALQGSECPFQRRILMHIAYHESDEEKVVEYRKGLGESHEDQLSLASIHFLRTQYQEAIDIYKKLLLRNRDWLALNVFLALCYSSMECYDVSLEILDAYLQALPPMIDILPEARMNLALHHLKHGETKEGYNLVKIFEPTSPQEYIVKAVSCASLGQEMEDAELLRQAQQYFQSVGASASECDTIPGRQCMASCHFLLKQFDDALIYLKSIKEYSEGQDEFHWNYGLALAASGNYQEAEEALLLVSNDSFRGDYCYQAWLCFCYIATGKAGLAWELYLSTESSSASFSLLLLIANESYKSGQYLYAAKAFDSLGRMDDSSAFWEGQRGAFVGVFQNVVAGEEPKETVLDILALLQNSNKSEAEYTARTIKKWAKECITL